MSPSTCSVACCGNEPVVEIIFAGQTRSRLYCRRHAYRANGELRWHRWQVVVEAPVE